MNAVQRREALSRCLTETPCPVSATALAQRFSVSRQIIVGDIALLRAAGANIVSTPRGYLVPREVGARWSAVTAPPSWSPSSTSWWITDALSSTWR